MDKYSRVPIHHPFIQFPIQIFPSRYFAIQIAASVRQLCADSLVLGGHILGKPRELPAHGQQQQPGVESRPLGCSPVRRPLALALSHRPTVPPSHQLILADCLAPASLSTEPIPPALCTTRRAHCSGAFRWRPFSILSLYHSISDRHSSQFV